MEPDSPLSSLLNDLSSEYAMYSTCFQDELLDLLKLFNEVDFMLKSIGEAPQKTESLKEIDRFLISRQFAIESRLKGIAAGLQRSTEKLESEANRLFT